MSPAQPNREQLLYGLRSIHSFICQLGRHKIFDQSLQDQLHLLQYIHSNAGKYNSQLGQDVFAIAMSQFKRGGYFVEIGAYHGELLSNTFMLERDYGWNGILVEPDPTNHDSLEKRAAKLVKKAAWNRSGEKLRFNSVPDSALSVIADIPPSDAHNRDNAKEIVVETLTLNDILEQAGAPNTIDFISMDVEGAELQVLEGIDFNRWSIQAMCIEHNHDVARIESYEKLLGQKGFVRAFEIVSDFDCYFVRTEILESWRKTLAKYAF